MKQNHEYFKDNSLLVTYFNSALLLLIFAYPPAFASASLRGLRDARIVVSPPSTGYDFLSASCGQKICWGYKLLLAEQCS